MSLIEIAATLYEINSDYRLDVYGNIPNDEVKKGFEGCKGIRYKGFISYSEVLEIMKKSDLIVHAEAFDEFSKWDLRYAFTTKIADALSCGTCFFVYAPDGLACTEYLKDNNCACVVTDKTKLKKELQSILYNKALRNEYAGRAHKIAEKNHNSEKNCSRFQEILKESAM